MNKTLDAIIKRLAPLEEKHIAREESPGSDGEAVAIAHERINELEERLEELTNRQLRQTLIFRKHLKKSTGMTPMKY